MWVMVKDIPFPSVQVNLGFFYHKEIKLYTHTHTEADVAYDGLGPLPTGPQLSFTKGTYICYCPI